jgi:hypothetical protein
VTFLTGVTASADTPIPFAEVRRILSDKCFHCHGPDQAQRQAGLRLDDRDAALVGGDSGPALMPGKSAESLIWKRINDSDEKQRMPPPGAKALNPQEVETLRGWIDQGANYETHWSYRPIKRPPIPQHRDPWIKNAIDQFVVDGLRGSGLTPNPRADVFTLRRRLHLDLIGMPEVPFAYADVDDSSDCTTLIDSLLSSPHFGEKWGRDWLDGARYADSDGFEKDKPRSVWFYRDWVVRALNSDMRYDEFVIEQLAGDLLPNATQDQRVATGFLRNSMINEEGGVDPEQFRMEAMFDRMDAIGKSILGLTIGCSQCHDHKFDPISQEDYYRVFAFFNRSAEGSAPMFTPEQQREVARIHQRMEQIDQELMHSHSEVDSQLSAWESRIRGDQSHWSVIRPHWNDTSLGGCKMLPQEDGSFLAQSYAPTKSEMWGSVPMDASQPDRITALRLECMTDPNLPLGGPGRSIFGYGALSEIKVYVAPLDKPESKTQIKIAAATSDLNPPRTPLPTQFADKSNKQRWLGPIEYAIDGANETAWSLDAGPGRTHQSRNAVFVFDTPIEDARTKIIYVHLVQHHGGWNSDDNQNCNLGRVRFAVTDEARPTADQVPRDVRRIVENSPRDQRTEREQAKVFAHWRSQQPEYAQQTEEIERLWQSYPMPTSQLVYQEAMHGRPTRLLERGDFLKPTKLVTAGVPGFLHPLRSHPTEPSRLDFARWAVDSRSPLAARVVVNRVWQALFGVGLARTSEDLGSQSELPTHPELLDYLASQLMSNQWSIKSLLREILSSATYQQSARVTPDHLRLDPGNRLLARSPRVRVSGESVRDIALAASGLLDERLGGVPVFPPAPDFLFQPPVSYGPKVWKESEGGDRYRRALYTFRFRSVPYPALQVFDTPNGDSACVKRSISNTPLQALTALNETVFVECAQSLARLSFEDLLVDASDTTRLQWIALRVLQRPLVDREVSTLLDLLTKTREQLIDEARAKELAGWDSKSLNAVPTFGQTPHCLASWTTIARVLLNLDESITKE